jgi:hypothetical protein
MGFTRVIYVRRWKWLPWFKRKRFVACAGFLDKGQIAPAFDDSMVAFHFSRFMDLVEERDYEKATQYPKF